MALGALILTGGRSRRMGKDKALLEWNGRTALAVVAELATAVGAAHVVAVGAPAPDLPFVPDESPKGGPVAGIVAGAVWLSRAGCERSLVLAVDAPTIQPGDLDMLLDAPAPGAAYGHLHLPMVMWLGALPAHAGGGWSMARLVTEMKLPLIEPPASARLRLRGANTPEEREALLAELAAS